MLRIYWTYVNSSSRKSFDSKHLRRFNARALTLPKSFDSKGLRLLVRIRVELQLNK